MDMMDPTVKMVIIQHLFAICYQYQNLYLGILTLKYFRINRVFNWLKYYTIFVDIDECASSPCQNSGNCMDQINGYTCNCFHGYDGSNCENGNN